MRDSLNELGPAWIPTLLAVARTRNYTHAAQQLYLTQSAISRQMQALQKAAGVRLVEQIGKALELTDAGRALVREAERIQAAITRASEVLDAIRGGHEGRLRIGASTTPGFYLLPLLLRAFVVRHPTVEVTFTVANTLEIEEALLRNDLDVGFVGGHLASGELVAEPLVRDEVVVFAARSHPLARARRVSRERLVEQTFVLREPGSATRELFEGWLAKHGLELGRTIELCCPEAIKTLVAQGGGVAISSCHALAATGKRFKTLSVPGLKIERTILVARHRDKRWTPLQEEFVEAVRRESSPCSVSRE